MVYSILAALLVTVPPITTPTVNPPRVDIQRVGCPVQEQHALLLYYTPGCPYCQKVLKYLKKIHKQLPMINLKENPEAKADLLKVGGKLQVPCLVIDGVAMYESDAIIEWLSQHQDELENTP